MADKFRLAEFGVLAGAGAALIIAGGVVHGRATQRWGPGDELIRAAESVARFPEAFGPWRVERAEELPEAVVRTLRCEGYVTRSYVHTGTSERIDMFVIAGPPGPTAVHTPEICYQSRDFKLIGARERIAPGEGGSRDTFWSTRLKSRLPGGADRYVCYAWTTGGHWRASPAPRYEYGGGRHLYKIQVSGSPLAGAGEKDRDLCERFLADLLLSGWRPAEVGS